MAEPDRRARDVRPPVLSDELAVRLDDLLRFRHVFRNLYVLDLDERRIRQLMDDLLELHSEVRHCPIIRQPARFASLRQCWCTSPSSLRFAPDSD